jgi:hypothetical protein
VKIIGSLPIYDRYSEAWTPDGVASVKPFQIVVTVSLSIGDFLEPGARRFPAILDTGLNHNFAIRREHLDRWTTLSLPMLRQVTIQNRDIPLAAAHVWLHRNRPGTSSIADLEPIRLRTPEGIAVFPANVSNPARLPILGLRALVRNHLKLIIDGNRRQVTLKTAGWFS